MGFNLVVKLLNPSKVCRCVQASGDDKTFGEAHAARFPGPDDGPFGAVGFPAGTRADGLSRKAEPAGVAAPALVDADANIGPHALGIPAEEGAATQHP